MATSCEGNNWFWDYFTTVNNIAKCDICNTSLKITRVPKGNILRHIKTEHNVDYQRIVSSGNSQKDLESQLYIIQNNDITCKFCNLTFYALNAFYPVRWHLEKTHKIKKDKAAEICEWLRKYYFDESDTYMKRRCPSCNETILNKPLLLMSHLSKVHKIDVPLRSKLMRYWVWEYYTRSKRFAKCSVCSEDFVLTYSNSNILYHIRAEHSNIFDVSENSQENKKRPYSITENNQIKCDKCDKSYDLIFYASPYMKTHLIEAHKLDESITRKLCNWVLEYFHISKLQTSKCNICENMFQTSNSFNLMIHLKEAHQVQLPPEIVTRLSSELSSLLNSDRYTQNNATSSSYHQPTRNVDQSSDCDNLYDQIDNPSEIKTMRLWDSLSSFLRFVRHSEDIAISSNYQQSTYRCPDFQIIELHKFEDLNIVDASNYSIGDMMYNSKLKESELLFRRSSV